MLALLLALLLCAPAQALAQCTCPAPARTIAVSGTGEVSLPPTVGSTTLYVEVTAPSAAKALAQVSAATNQVLEAVKPRLSGPDRLTTEDYDLSPIYEHPERGKPRLVGYRGVSRLRLEVAGPKRLGELLDLAVASGATGLSGITFSNPETAEAKRSAAALALKDARALAERVAAEARVKLGRLLSASTTAEEGPRPYRDYGVMAAAEAAPPPIEPGALKVRASVSAVYEISSD